MSVRERERTRQRVREGHRGRGRARAREGEREREKQNERVKSNQSRALSPLRVPRACRLRVQSLCLSVSASLPRTQPSNQHDCLKFRCSLDKTRKPLDSSSGPTKQHARTTPKCWNCQNAVTQNTHPTTTCSLLSEKIGTSLSQYPEATSHPLPLSHLATSEACRGPQGPHTIGAFIIRIGVWGILN